MKSTFCKCFSKNRIRVDITVYEIQSIFHDCMSIFVHTLKQELIEWRKTPNLGMYRLFSGSRNDSTKGFHMKQIVSAPDWFPRFPIIETKKRPIPKVSSQEKKLYFINSFTNGAVEREKKLTQSKLMNKINHTNWAFTLFAGLSCLLCGNRFDRFCSSSQYCAHILCRFCFSSICRWRFVVMDRLPILFIVCLSAVRHFDQFSNPLELFLRNMCDLTTMGRKSRKSFTLKYDNKCVERVYHLSFSSILKLAFITREKRIRESRQHFHISVAVCLTYIGGDSGN